MDIIVDFRKAPSGSVNKTEGFMPVRHDSVATNNVRFPYFASDDGESNNLTHSCPDRRDDFSHLLQSLNSPTSKPSNHLFSTMETQVIGLSFYLHVLFTSMCKLYGLLTKCKVNLLGYMVTHEQKPKKETCPKQS